MAVPARSTVRSACGRARSSVQRAGAEQHEIGGQRRRRCTPWSGRPMMAAGAERGDGRRPSSERMVEMEDAHAPRGTPRPCRDRHRRRTGRGCCRRRRRPARRAPVSSWSSVTPRQRGVRPARAVLQVHVAHRQRDDGDAGLGDALDRRLAPPPSAARRASSNGRRRSVPAKPVAERRVGDGRAASAPSGRRSRRHGGRGRGRGSPRGRDQRLDQRFEVGHHVGDGRRGRRHARSTVVDQVVEIGLVARTASMPTMRHRLQFDAAGPARRASRRRPASEMRCCGGDGIEMGADERGAVGIGGAQREIHAPLDVVRPTSWPRGRRRTASSAPHEGAVRIAAGAARYGPCRDGCACRRRHGQTMPRSRSNSAVLRSARRRGAMRAMRPSTMPMSAATEPLAVRLGGGIVERARAGTVALAST